MALFHRRRWQNPATCSRSTPRHLPDQGFRRHNVAKARVRKCLPVSAGIILNEPDQASATWLFRHSLSGF
jgi:hypothetical protein